MSDNRRGTSVKNFTIIAVVALSLFGAGMVACFLFLNHATARDVKNYLESVYRIERAFVEKVPLYEDHVSPQLEQKLRTYLNPAHIDAASRFGVGPVTTGAEVNELISGGKLVRVEAGPESLFYFYNVKHAYRALTPAAFRGITLLTERLQRNLQGRADLPPVKIAVSSMLRPASYQDGLRETNPNATMITTHSSGISFDIFFDDYYVVLPQPDAPGPISNAILTPVRNRLGFLMGDALSGQIRTMLAETLIQLQDEGVLYAILEKRQRCYHVTILGETAR